MIDVYHSSSYTPLPFRGESKGKRSTDRIMEITKYRSNCKRSRGLSDCVVVLIVLLVLQVCSQHLATLARAQQSVKFLPGFEGPLPFELETGYIGVGESDDLQLFYYFIKSEGNPKEDPLMLWETGGPGCSSLSGLLFEIGPIALKDEEYTGGVPKLVLRPESWTKVCSILFLDSPIGSGFSYSQTQTSSSDTKQVQHAYQFLRKWLTEIHPEFLSNPLYIAGDSYSGIPVPVLVKEISDGNERGILPTMNLQGYILGNPATDPKDSDYQIPYAHGMALISDEMFASIKKNCGGEHMTNQSRALCSRDMQKFKESTSGLEKSHILKYLCEFTSPKPTGISSRSRSMREYQVPHLIDSRLSLPSRDCLTYVYFLSSYWANDEDVREALHVRKGTVKKWNHCSLVLRYEFDVPSSVPYHLHLSSKGYPALIYSGDHDMMIPFLATQAWIRSLNYSIVDEWRKWLVDDQIAGYTRTYSNRMTFATVKGGGHTAPMDRPKQCLAMLTRWFSGNPL